VVQFILFGEVSMAVLKRKAQESVMIVGSGGMEQLFKVTVMNVDGEVVTLKVDVPAGTMVHTLEEWEHVQTGKARQSGEQPKSRAAYGN
jgi:sRNA-binding carbon storage regulator CsrA